MRVLELCVAGGPLVSGEALARAGLTTATKHRRLRTWHESLAKTVFFYFLTLKSFESRGKKIV